jgi:hypothetical protein
MYVAPLKLSYYLSLNLHHKPKFQYIFLINKYDIYIKKMKD